MKIKKSITGLLILVLALQLLPVRQAVKYFFIDNQLVEELPESGKAASKNFKLFEEDQMLAIHEFAFQQGEFINTKLSFHFSVALPVTHAKDIHTPPPNNFFI